MSRLRGPPGRLPEGLRERRLPSRGASEAQGPRGASGGLPCPLAGTCPPGDASLNVLTRDRTAERGQVPGGDPARCRKER